MFDRYMKQRCTHVVAAFLAVAAMLSLSACGQASAAAEQPLSQVDLSAQKACPKGQVVEWIGPSEMQCLKEM